jgi:hypothetical protein
MRAGQNVFIPTRRHGVTETHGEIVFSVGSVNELRGARARVSVLKYFDEATECAHFDVREPRFEPPDAFFCAAQRFCAAAFIFALV